MSNPKTHHHCRLPPHIALFPSGGMGHLTPFLSLASNLLSNHHLTLTLITPKTTVSASESHHISFFLSTHPQITHLQFDTVPLSNPNNGDDPFFLQYSAISRSGHLLLPHLAGASPPVSAVFCDLLMAKSVAQITSQLNIPYYAVSTTSALFTGFMVHLPELVSDDSVKLRVESDGEVEIPGLKAFPVSSIPMPFLDPNHVHGANIVANMGALAKADGVLINTFEWFESETISALNSGKVLRGLPPIFAIGPLEPYELENELTQCIPWLDEQPEKSVLYVSFGSRTAMSNDQIKELRNGLERSGCRFLWVVKTTKVDREDKEDVKEVVGEAFLERTKGKGLVVKGWVNQQEILSHRAVSGFVSHCGWNSVMEAAARGVPVLVWPQHGDQRVNAEVVEKAGLGIWEERWGLGLVKEEEIVKKIEELVGDESVRERAMRVRNEARKAIHVGGSSKEAIMAVIKKIELKLP